MPSYHFHLPSIDAIRESASGVIMLHYIMKGREDKSLVLASGCPGSGKTTLAVQRLIALTSEGEKVLLFTFQHMLKNAIRNLAGIAELPRENVWTIKRWYYDNTKGGWLDFDGEQMRANDIMNGLNQTKLFKDGYDEVMFDEGQDLPVTVYESFPKCAKRVFVGGDDAQQVHEHGASVEEIRNALAKQGHVRECVLQYNYRNSYEIFNFARQFVLDDPRANNSATLDELRKRKGETGEKPRIYLYPGDKERLTELKKILHGNKSANIAVLCAQATDVRRTADWIKQQGFECSMHTSDATDLDIDKGDAVDQDLKNIVVTTFKSAKGMEFDIVVMPQFHKGGGSHEKFVACTRAVRELHIFCLGRELPDELTVFSEETFDGPISLWPEGSGDV